MIGADRLPLLAAQNLNEILRPLQWGVIALVFIFFLRVARAVIVETRPAGPRQTRRERRRARAEARSRQEPAPSRPQRSFRLEVLEPDEHKGVIYELDDEMTIGRSPGCRIPTTYDPFSSSTHARLFRSNGHLWVEDLGSTNGTYVNSERVARPHRLGRGDLVQVGATIYEVVR